MENPVLIGKAELHLGDCIEVMKTMSENSLDSIICDPPYLISFMSKGFDTQHKSLPGANEGQKMQEWHRRWVTEAYRILKPGGHLAAFGGDRTHHRLMSAMEDVGFELRQCGYWVFGSGFPKSQNASLALDQHFGMKDQREVVGQEKHGKGSCSQRTSQLIGHRPYVNGLPSENNGGVHSITEPAHQLAKQYSGYGTALKPATEIIAIGRKPMIGTLAENLLEWGCGAMNLDACRVETNDSLNGGAYSNGTKDLSNASSYATGINIGEFKQPIGRFPPHLLHDGSDVVKKCFPETTSGAIDPSRHIHKHGKGNALSGSKDGSLNNYLPHQKHEASSGSASRFFPSLPYDKEDCATLYYCGKASKEDRGHFNNHPTTKPTNLMKWICRLLTPKGGTLLDPFMGSGSTLKAASLEGFKCIGIEMDPDYFEIAKARVIDANKQPSLDLFSEAA